ncbi:hypothetical protein [Cellulomonas sp. B6]|uniref:hypothetical protein n=1 Tax=Cellulomonas sp. B6 TaxID=1295626 RepID=UPI00073B2B65|nr:hypothetical protein [Cellulomonas sp. B6]KSW21533.1 hypothetical protein ATM99_14190 [Cellulomonas sp. B6]
MTRRWTAPGVLAVLAAAVTVWLVRAVTLVTVDGFTVDAVTAPLRLLLYAAGPAVLCAVPVVLLARAAFARGGQGVAVHAGVGLAAGLLVGVVQTGVLLSTWPWLLDPGPRFELVVLPALGGLVGGVVAGLVKRRRARREREGARRPV